MIDIDIAKALQNEGTVFTYEYEAVPDLGPEISFAQPLKLSAEYSATKDEVAVRGHLVTLLNEKCDRCLTDMTVPFQSEFDEVFCVEGKQREDEYTYNGETLSLDKMVYNLILLKLPHQFLCKQDCKGLCPQCGQNLNEKQCECMQKDTDETNPFAKLKGLF